MFVRVYRVYWGFLGFVRGRLLIGFLFGFKGLLGFILFIGLIRAYQVYQGLSGLWVYRVERVYGGYSACRV